jgi:hypothetical protein
MTEDLLLLAESGEGSAFLQLQPISVSSVLSAAVDGLSGQAATAAAIELTTDGDLPAQADPDRLRQAVDNLIRNAIRHAPPGSVIEVSGRSGIAAGRRTVLVSVRDHGPGFPPDFLPHAFERFRRADPARSSRSGGSGLGLAIVASIAEAHGGRAAAVNHPAGGARVSLELPADGPCIAPELRHEREDIVSNSHIRYTAVSPPSRQAEGTGTNATGKESQP